MTSNTTQVQFMVISDRHDFEFDSDNASGAFQFLLPKVDVVSSLRWS